MTTFDLLKRTCFLSLLLAGAAAQAQQTAGPGWRNIVRDPSTIGQGTAASPLDLGNAPLPMEANEADFVMPGATAMTPELQELARGLYDDPVRIFNYVRNRIEFQPYYGSHKGAHLTHLEGAGNDMDQASLLIALLNEAGYTNTSYVYGKYTVKNTSSDGYNLSNWLGTTAALAPSLISNAGIPLYPGTNYGSYITWPFDHVWVRATIDGVTYDLDPSYKQRQIFSAIDFKTASGYSRSVLLSDAGGTTTDDYAQNVSRANVESRLSQCTTTLRNYLKTTYPNAEIEQILGGGRIAEHRITALTQGAPPAAFTPMESTTFDVIPSQYVATFRVQIDSDIDVTFDAHSLQGTRLSLTFSGNNAQLWWGDQSIAEQTAGSGASATVTLSITHPCSVNGFNLNQSFPVQYERNSSFYYDLAYSFYPNPLSSGVINASGRQLQNYLAQKVPLLTNTSREVLTETLHSFSLKWTRRVALSCVMVDKVQNCETLVHHIVGRAGQQSSYYVDMPGVAVSTFDASGFNHTAFNLAGFVASAMEHGVIEQNTTSSALSTVKCLALANDSGQKIYKATAANYDSTVSAQLSNYSTNQLNSFGTTTGSGATLLLHSDGHTGIDEWFGYGYAQFNDANNAVGMIIGGGLNGGYASKIGTVDGVATNTINQSQSNQQFAPPSIPQVTSAEPVDLLTGAYTMEKTDLALGEQGSPRGLNFSRYYDSSRAFVKSDLGNGWRHSCGGKVTLSSELDNPFGLTQPADAAQTIIGFLAAGDFVGTAMSPQELLVGALTANWTVNRMKDNAANVQLGNQRMTYISQPDGSWTPPPGSTTALTGSKGSFTLSPRFGGSIAFDAQDRVSTWSDVDNNTQTYTYSGTAADSKLTSVSDQYGRTLTFAYNTSGDSSGLLQSVTDSTGRSAQFAYFAGVSGDAELTTVTDPENYTNTYAYDFRNRLTYWKDHAGGTITRNYYDDFDRVVRQNSQGNNTHRWLFAYAPGATLEVNPLDGITTHLFDYKNRNAGTIDALDHATSLSYDGKNHVVKAVDATGKQSLSVYDSNQNLTSSTDNAGKSTTYQYDLSLRLWTVTDPTSLVTEYGYDSENHLTSVKDPGLRETKYAYRTDGLPSSVTDPANNITTFSSYDAYGNPTGVTKSDATTTSATYNARGDLLTATDGRSQTTTFTYDKRRLLKTSVDAKSHTSSYTYDSNGNPATATDRNGNTVTSVYDNLGHVKSVTRSGSGTTTYAYDVADRLVSVTDGLSHTTTTTYDAAGRRTALTNALNDIAAQWTYDNAGRVTVRKDGLLKETKFFYDTAGRLDYSRDPLNHDTDHSYDDAGRPLSLTDKRGGTYGFGYGTDGLPTTFTYPTSTAQNLRQSNIVDRETRGLPHIVAEPSGQRATLGYDNLGRLTTRSDDVGAIAWTYDNEGNPTAVAETIGSATKTISRVFDELGRVTSCTDAQNYTVGYTYDTEGNVLTITYPGNKTVTYTYDNANRLNTVTDWSNRTTTYTYDGIGRLDTVTRPNATRQQVSFDAANRLTASYEEKLSGTTVTGTLWSALYGYDKANRLTSFAPLPMERNVAPPAVSMTYDADNQLATYNGQAVGHDLDGNLQAAPVNGTLLGAVTWDARNRLLSAGGVSYTYDAENRRATSTTSAGTTRYIYSRGARLDRLLAKVNPDNSVTRYVYGSGLLYEETTNASGTVLSTLYYHFDWRGDTVALSDTSGNVTARMSYSPYGERTVESGTVNTPFCFGGRWGVATEPSGLVCMQARYYSTIFRRFLSEDPSGFSGGVNLYAYAGGDPIDAMDPFGLGPVSTASNSGVAAILSTPVSFTPCIECHGVSAAGFSGNTNGFQGLGQLTNSARSAVAFENFADSWSQEGMQVTIEAFAVGLSVGLSQALSAGRTSGEVVQRAMSRAELEATQSTGLLRGGREGPHYVSDAVNSSAGRAQQRLALPQAPEVRATLSVPANTFSSPTRVQPKFNMPGGGSERTGTGSIPVKVLRVDEL